VPHEPCDRYHSDAVWRRAQIRLPETAASVLTVRIDAGERCSTPSTVSVCLPSHGATAHTSSFAELALKLVLNALSTGGHVLKGTVFRNRMINLTLTNVKLFHRATKVVVDFGDVPESTGGHCCCAVVPRRGR
jgi:N-acetylmuramic acid 6-phosphate (MurNAc-6-P) etherase